MMVQTRWAATHGQEKDNKLGYDVVEVWELREGLKRAHDLIKICRRIIEWMRVILLCSSDQHTLLDSKDMQKFKLF